MKSEELQTIRERVSETSRGPWKVSKNPWFQLFIENADGLQVTLMNGGNDTVEVDTEFIAHAREDVPALLDEIDRLRHVLIELEDGWIPDQWLNAREMIRQALEGEST